MCKVVWGAWYAVDSNGIVVIIIIIIIAVLLSLFVFLTIVTTTTIGCFKCILVGIMSQLAPMVKDIPPDW